MKMAAMGWVISLITKRIWSSSRLYILNQNLIWYWVRVMVFNVTFNNISGISWRSVLLVEEIRLPGEKHWQTLSHNAVSWAGLELTTLVVISTDCKSSCKSNYHTIKTMATPNLIENLICLKYILQQEERIKWW